MKILRILGTHTLERKSRMIIEEKSDRTRERIEHDVVSLVRKMEAIPEEQIWIIGVDMRVANCAEGIRMCQLPKGCIEFASDPGCHGLVCIIAIKAPGKQK